MVSQLKEELLNTKSQLGQLASSTQHEDSQLTPSLPAGVEIISQNTQNLQDQENMLKDHNNNKNQDPKHEQAKMNESLCGACGKISDGKNMLNNSESHDNSDLLIQIQMRDKELKYLHDLL